MWGKLALPPGWLPVLLLQEEALCLHPEGSGTCVDSPGSWLRSTIAAYTAFSGSPSGPWGCTPECEPAFGRTWAAVLTGPGSMIDIGKESWVSGPGVSIQVF